MDLYLAEIAVSDVSRSVAWYCEVLGLDVVLWDEANQYVLLAAGSTRLSLRGSTGRNGRDAIRLTFLIDDIDAHHRRLDGLGVSPGPIRENAAERFRESRLADPDGTVIVLFAWTDQETSGRT